MNDMNIRAQVAFISNIIDIAGSVIPVIHLKEPVGIGDNSTDTIDLSYTDTGTITSFCKDDRLVIYLPEDNCSLPIVVMEEEGQGVRTPIRPTHCPYCGAPLIYNSGVFGRCINRYCGAQSAKYVYILLGALGIQVTGEIKYVTDSILSSSVLHSPADILHFTYEDYPPHLRKEDIDIFTNAVHSAVNNIRIPNILSALNIEGWTYKEYTDITKMFGKYRWTVKDIFKLTEDMYMHELENCNNTDMSAWREYLSLHTNIRYLHELSLLKS